VSHRLVSCQCLEAQAAVLVGEQVAAWSPRYQQIVAILKGSFAFGSQRVLELAIEEPAFPTRIERYTENSVERTRPGGEVMLMNAAEGMFQRIVRGARRQEGIEDL